MIAFLLVGALVALISLLLTGVTLRYLKQKAVLDHPNERSSHSTPTSWRDRVDRLDIPVRYTTVGDHVLLDFDGPNMFSVRTLGRDLVGR